MELNNLDYSELDLAIEQALTSSSKKVFNDEDQLIYHADFLIEQFIEIDSHKHQTIDDHFQNCVLIHNTLDDIIHLLNNLMEKYYQNENTLQRIEYGINFLQILKNLYKIVITILKKEDLEQNEEVRQLLELYKGNEEYSLKARQLNDINFYGLKHMNHTFGQRTLKQILHICQNYLINHDSEALKEQLTIYNSHLNILVRIFASAIDMDQQDLLCLDKTHVYWKQIKSVSTYTKLSSNTEKILQSYDNFMKSIRIGHAVFLKKSKFQNQYFQKLIFGLSSIWYFLFDSRARYRAIEHMSDMEIGNAVNVMSMVEQPGIKKLIEFGITSIKVNLKIYIDPVVNPLTLQNFNKQFQSNILNKITEQQLEYVNSSVHYDKNSHNKLFQKDSSKLRIRILSSIDLERTNKFEQFFKKTISSRSYNIQEIETIIIHFHGGGFISMSSSSHQNYTREWANQLGIPIFSVDYSLAPKYRYPQAVDDCWQAYNWILTYLQYHFNIKPKNVLLAGDSAGGNLCCALTALTIKYGIKIPDGLLLSYPVLDLKMKYSPSHLNGLDDFLLNHTLMDICIDAYTNHPNSYEYDPFRSPNHLSDEILKHFPPVRILVGSKDPLIDHSHRLAHQLLKNQRNIKITVYEGMSHGFLSFYMVGGMKESFKCIEDSILCLQELLKLKK